MREEPPRDPVAHGPRGRARWAVGLVAAVCVLAVIIAGSYAALSAMHVRTAWVDHCDDVGDTLEHLQLLVADGEAAQRGYLLTDRADYLDPYVRMAVELPASLTMLRGLVAGDRQQEARLQRLEAEVTRRQRRMARAIDERRVHGLLPAIDFLTADEAKDTRDRVRVLSSEMIEAEETLLRTRVQSVEHTHRYAVGLVVGGSLTLVLLVTSLMGMRRQLAREALRIAEGKARLDAELARLKTIFENVPAAIGIVRGPSHVFEYANPVERQALGDRQLLGRPLRDALPEPAFASFVSLFDRVYASGEPAVGEAVPFPGLDAEGQQAERYASFALQPLRDGQGRIEGVVAFSVDVTGRVLAQRRLEQILEQVALGVIACDPTGKVVFYNSRSTEILGARIESLEHGTSWSPRAPDGTPLPIHRLPLARGLRGETTRGEEMLIRRTDGLEVSLRVSTLPVRDAAGAVALSVSVFEDITDEKRRREERDRAAEFAERFIAIVSHDLRTPLSAIVLGAGRLLRQELRESDRKTADRILSSAQRMTGMVNQLLDLTRSRLGGGIEVAPRRTDVVQIVTQVIGEIEMANPERDIRLQVDNGPLDGEYDADRLAQVVANLVGNALVHGAPEGAILVSVRAEGVTAVLEIGNDGADIPPELLPRIFDPFRRGATPARASGGLGLGLYITQQIVAAHGGRIDVRSANRHTRFTVRLPRFPLHPRAPVAVA